MFWLRTKKNTYWYTFLSGCLLTAVWYYIYLNTECVAEFIFWIPLFYQIYIIHARIKNVLSEGVQHWQRFFSWWGERGSKYHHKRAVTCPPAKRHFKWRFAGLLMIAQHWMLAWQLRDFQGIRTSIAHEPLALGFSRAPCPPSESAHDIPTRI